jgi:uncharacterized BrkB/YihY/UPF0761 family membrane protein
VIILFNKVFPEEQMTTQPQEENRHLFSKTIVVLAVISIYLYTITVLVFSWHYRVVPNELTVGYYTFWGVEMLALAYKHTKQKTAELQYNNYNEGSDIL